MGVFDGRRRRRFSALVLDKDSLEAVLGSFRGPGGVHKLYKQRWLKSAPQCTDTRSKKEESRRRDAQGGHGKWGLAWGIFASFPAFAALNSCCGGFGGGVFSHHLGRLSISDQRQ